MDSFLERTYGLSKYVWWMYGRQCFMFVASCGNIWHRQMVVYDVGAGPFIFLCDADNGYARTPECVRITHVKIMTTESTSTTGQ